MRRPNGAVDSPSAGDRPQGRRRWRPASRLWALTSATGRESGSACHRRIRGVASRPGGSRTSGSDREVETRLLQIMRVRCRDFHPFDAGVLHVTEPPCAIGARCLDADTLQRSEGAHPDEHLLVAVPSGGKALTCHHPIKLIDNGSDMKIFIRVDAANNATARRLLTNFQTGSPGSTRCGGFYRSRLPGQDSNATERQALLESHASVRRNLTA
jgi:hypothetical protein